MKLAIYKLAHRNHLYAASLAHTTVLLRTTETVRTETMVITHDERLDVMAIAKKSQKLLRRKGMNLLKRQHQYLAKSRQELIPFLSGGEHSRLVVGLQGRTRMAVESHNKRRELTLLRQTTQVVKKKLMPLVDTIEKTYRGNLPFHLTPNTSLLLVVAMLDAVLEFGILDELNLYARDSTTVFLRSTEYVVELLGLIHLAV